MSSDDGPERETERHGATRHVQARNVSGLTKVILGIFKL
jgi:hypothetical protein